MLVSPATPCHSIQLSGLPSSEVALIVIVSTAVLRGDHTVRGVRAESKGGLGGTKGQRPDGEATPGGASTARWSKEGGEPRCYGGQRGGTTLGAVISASDHGETHGTSPHSPLIWIVKGNGVLGRDRLANLKSGLVVRLGEGCHCL
jgi:hypothetical protein